MRAGDHSFMGGQEGMHKERAGYPSWPLVTCRRSYIAGPHIPEAAVSTAVGGQVTTLLCLPQCWCRGRLAVVECIPSGLEWYILLPNLAPAMEVMSDASGTYGGGAFSLPHGWFQLEWPEIWLPVHITAKELLPIVIASALWGNQWKCKCICFRSDNMAVVDILKSRTSRDQLRIHLLRCLVFYAAFYRFNFVSEHVPGVLNTAADAISRNNVSILTHRCPADRFHSQS